MSSEIKDFEKLIVEYVDQVKDFMSPELWQNVLLDCSKNELFVMWFLYRNESVNMTQIAEYISVPLNTATGIISRMEKKKLVYRSHSAQDKRVVTISLAENGSHQLNQIMQEVMYYVQKVFAELSDEESKLLFSIMGKVMEVVKAGHTNEQETKKIKKITIE